MFWIEKYRPRQPEDILGQEEVCRVLMQCAHQKNLPHLLVSGVHGTGKSSAVEVMLRTMYGESWQDNTTIFHTADLMDRGRTYLENEEHFMHLYHPELSFLANLKHIISSYAAIKPINADFKILLFEDAYALSHDIQHSLRRTMERFSTTCRFIFVSTHTSSIIPPISSRCLPLFFTPLPREIIRTRLKEILIAEQVQDALDDEELGLIVAASSGDLRKAIMYLQIRVSTKKPFDPDTLNESETRIIGTAAFRAMQAKDVRTAQTRLETLMIEYGLSGQEVMMQLRDAAHREFNHPRILSCIADTDHILTHAGNEYIQVNALAARIVSEVFL